MQMVHRLGSNGFLDSKPELVYPGALRATLWTDGGELIACRLDASQSSSSHIQSAKSQVMVVSMQEETQLG